jgi:UDP:flavonoid glycosyltransferase YjiC (YdhE family)
MAKFLLTWEAGANLGHEMQVRAAATLLRDAGHDVVIYSPHTRPPETAPCAGIRWEHIPGSLDNRAPPTGVEWESRATALWKAGFHSADFIRDRFHAWDAVLQREQPSAVALQAAPFAQLAARIGGVPSIEFGIGFDVPPQQAPFPAFRHRERFDVSDALRLEHSMLERLERVLGSAVKSAALHELVSGQKRVVVSIRELDHYDGIDGNSREFVGPLPIVELSGSRPKWIRGKPRVLAYVRAPLLDAPQLLKAIASLRGDAVVICFEADEATVRLARSLGIRIHLELISIGDLLPAADLVVSHGGGGLMAAAAIRGRPCVALPSNYEQFMTAATLQRHQLGVMVNPKEPTHYESALRRALGDPHVRRGAAAAAMRYRGTSQRSGAAFVAAVEALVEVK